MDERLLEIFKLVLLLNQKGKGLRLALRENGIDLVDSNYENIIPYWTNNIYFDEFWKNEYDDMVNSTLEVLKKMLSEEDKNWSYMN